MLNIHADSHTSSTANEMGTDELLHNLQRFPASVLPVGVLRELQSRGEVIHDSLVSLIGEAMDAVLDGKRSRADASFFAFALLIPIATNDDRPLVESLLTLPGGAIDNLLGDLVSEAIPYLIARFFRDQSAPDVIDWIDRVADHQDLVDLYAFPLYRGMTVAVAMGVLDRITAINALINRLKKRSDIRYDQQSAQIVCEFLDLSARDVEEVDAVVRSCFQRGQIDTDYVDLGSWDRINTHDRSCADEIAWIDSAEELKTFCYDYVSDDLDPVNATYRVNEWASGGTELIAQSVTALVDQLRKSSDKHFPEAAVQSLNVAFASAYQATIDLIREEVARYQAGAESWSGNGAYLGLVLTISHRMPLPTDLLQTILRLPQADREQLFGDQFGLIVQAVALTPLQQHDFVEQWIWDVDRCQADRREMVGFYLEAHHNGQLERAVAIEALVVGLRRALHDEPSLIAPYAENLAFLASPEQAQVLDEAYQRQDVEWFLPLPKLRSIAIDSSFAMNTFQERSLSYCSARQIIADGVMFDEVVDQAKSRNMPPPTPAYQPQPEFSSATTIRNDVRTPRNAPCPCGSGKKFKKCCLHK